MNGVRIRLCFFGGAGCSFSFCDVGWKELLGAGPVVPSNEVKKLSRLCCVLRFIVMLILSCGSFCIIQADLLLVFHSVSLEHKKHTKHQSSLGWIFLSKKIRSRVKRKPTLLITKLDFWFHSIYL